MMTSRGTLPRSGIGRILISLVAAEAAAGPYLADWNETHIYNPSWPPHAKFHNGQTMSMGVALALATFWQLWRKHDTLDDARQALDSASLSASLYWLTQTSALAYPGAKAVDPPGTPKFPKWKFAAPSLPIVALGNAFERRRLRRMGHAGNPPDGTVPPARWRKLGQAGSVPGRAAPST